MSDKPKASGAKASSAAAAGGAKGEAKKQMTQSAKAGLQVS